MKKNELNARFRAHAKERLSPSEKDRDLVSKVYASVQEILGDSQCLQIGSYPRFTAISPLHDLDILYILGKWDTNAHDPSTALSVLLSKFTKEYKNPTAYSLQISRQTHSITLAFFSGRDTEIFSVDIVPAYVAGVNEFGDDRYVVPEIVSKSHRERNRIMSASNWNPENMLWVKSDPRGYIKVATQVNQSNEDFRKAAKLLKGWRASCKRLDEEFPLKSFHIEQIVTDYFQQDPGLEIFDAVFKFFIELPNTIMVAKIPDRADPNKKIDAYIDDLTDLQRERVLQMRDFFLVRLEEFSEGDEVSDLLNAGFHKRASETEAFLFDEAIPMLCEQDFSITGRVLPRSGGFRERLLDAIGLIEIDRKIEFRLGRNAPSADLYKWKVKNDNKSEQPRGEITDHRTLRDPEETKFRGNHYVECFAIRDGVCIGRSRQNVILKGFGSH